MQLHRAGSEWHDRAVPGERRQLTGGRVDRDCALALEYLVIAQPGPDSHREVDGPGIPVLMNRRDRSELDRPLQERRILERIQRKRREQHAGKSAVNETVDRLRERALVENGRLRWKVRRTQ